MPTIILSEERECGDLIVEVKRIEGSLTPDQVAVLKTVFSTWMDGPDTEVVFWTQREGVKTAIRTLKDCGFTVEYHRHVRVEDTDAADVLEDDKDYDQFIALAMKVRAAKKALDAPMVTYREAQAELGEFLAKHGVRTSPVFAQDGMLSFLGRFAGRELCIAATRTTELQVVRDEEAALKVIHSDVGQKLGMAAECLRTAVDFSKYDTYRVHPDIRALDAKLKATKTIEAVKVVVRPHEPPPNSPKRRKEDDE